MTYFLDPHGCAKNQVDAETMMAALDRAGWAAAADPAAADLLIVNSCGFIESAKAESIQATIALKAAYPDKKVLLAGCLAQRYPGELAADLSEADGFFGNADLSRVPEAAAAVMAGERPALVPPIDPTGGLDFASCSGDRPLLSLPGSAYVKVTEGCDNRCSFCAIPLIRGGLRSRPVDAVVEECRSLLARGVKELCVIGQDLGSYGIDFEGGRCRLAELLDGISALEGDFWVRLLYIHPDRFPREILSRCAADPRILPYFDLPFQHASGRILRAMNRRGDAAAYLSLLDGIRAVLPDATIRSTFLVGFPGETEEDFRELLAFQAAARIDWLGAFCYSREDGTAAYAMKGRVPKKVAAERRARIEAAQGPIVEARMDRFVGRRMDVLVEEKVEGEEGLYLGRAACQAPEVDGSVVLSCEGDLALGGFVSAAVFRRAGIDLDAAVLDPAARAAGRTGAGL